MAQSITRRAVGAMLPLAPMILPGRGVAQTGTRKIVMQLGWLLTAYHAGDVVAKQNGYLEEEKIDLTFSPGGPSIDGVATVASGRAEIGQISSSPSIMYAVSQKIPIQCFAVGARRHPFAYFSLPANPIRTPQDMIGKKIGLPATAKILHAALLKKNGIPENAVEVVTVGADKSPLLTGRVHALTSWTTDLGSMAEASDLILMRLSDYGVRLHALPYYAPKAVIANDSDLLVRFVRAVAKGWRYVKANPEAAADILLKQSPNLNRAHILAGIRDFLTYAYSPEAAGDGWGSFSPDGWAEQIALFDELNQFSAGAPKLEDVMTTSILAATRDARLRIS